MRGRRGRTSRRPAHGFTLIELVVTVAIVGVLAAGALPLAQLAAQRAQEAELRAALRQIRDGIDAYKAAFDAGRIERRSGASGYPPELDTLVKGVPDAGDPAGRRLYFLRRLPRDPFYAETGVPAAQSWGKRSYASPPGAPREGADVFDVYSLSPRSGLNGLPYREW